MCRLTNRQDAALPLSDSVNTDIGLYLIREFSKTFCGEKPSKWHVSMDIYLFQFEWFQTLVTLEV